MPDNDSVTRRTLLQGLGATTAAGAVGTDLVAASGPSGGDDGYWTTGEQYGVATVADHGSPDPSQVWFTLTEGALASARFPRADLMNLRTLDFLVTNGMGYAVRTFEGDRTDDDPVERSVEPTADDALTYRQTATDSAKGWKLSVEYAVDPDGDSILADVSFTATGRGLDVYVLVDTALSNSGMSDAASVQTSGGDTVLAAHDTGANDDQAVILDADGEPFNVATALASRNGFAWATVDVVGGDSLSPLVTTGDASTRYESASGNVVLAGHLDGTDAQVHDTLALGFATDGDENAATTEAARSLNTGFDSVRTAYAKTWRDYLQHVDVPESVQGDPARRRQYQAAAMCLKAVESKQFPGAGLASPSVPWGEATLANSPSDYGYNYVWSRDLYQSFTALAAMGDVDAARDAVEYLYEYQQDDDGFLPQNTFLDGRTRWGGEQMDNISFPAIMTHHLLADHDHTFEDLSFGYDEVRASADYVAANGPFTGQERWEEESGLSPSTTAAEIAGLACAAAIADDEDARGDALVYLALADYWESKTEDWMATTTGTDEHPDTPYYFRINDDRDPDDGATHSINNGGPTLDERNIIDAGFLELVRLGVKPHDDPVIENSLDVVDDTIRVETPNGPGFYRYNGDGYGEQGQDGSQPAGAPWSLDHAGKGRLWPIFTGERAEYELHAGNEDPETLLDTMQGFANSGRMIPEQVWDRPEPTEYGWAFGEGTGSATPLSWSMAQYIRLAHGIDAGEPVETPAVVRNRYASGTGTPAGPSLDVDFPPTVVGDQTVTVSGTTDGAQVVVKSGDATRLVEPTDGAFSVDVAVSDGETQLTVVAATDTGPVTEVGTTVERSTVAYVDVGTPVAEFQDAEGDDHGPGTYVYPQNDVFVDGAFDLTSFGVYETDSTYQFVARIRGDLTNPWGGNSISVQYLQVYLRDPAASGGSTQARAGVNVDFEAPYQYRVLAEGFSQPRIESPDGSTVSTDVTLTAYRSVSTIKVEAPKSVFGDVTDYELAPLMLCQDGYNTGQIRPVVSLDTWKNGANWRQQWQFGGGRDDNMDPNVIDLVTPDGVTNADALDYSATEQAVVPYVTL